MLNREERHRGGPRQQLEYVSRVADALFESDGEAHVMMAVMISCVTFATDLSVVSICRSSVKPA